MHHWSHATPVSCFAMSDIAIKKRERREADAKEEEEKKQEEEEKKKEEEKREAQKQHAEQLEEEARQKREARQRIHYNVEIEGMTYEEAVAHERMRTRVFAAMDRAYACAQEIMQPREQQQAAAAERQRAEQAELDLCDKIKQDVRYNQVQCLRKCFRITIIPTTLQYAHVFDIAEREDGFHMYIYAHHALPQQLELSKLQLGLR